MVSHMQQRCARMAGAASLVAMGMSLVAQAWADGECLGGYRDTTTAEREAMIA